MDSLPITTVIGLLAFIAGGVFGAVTNRTNFCTMGAISDWILMGDLRRMRAWMLAVAVATVGTQWLHAAGFINVNESIYRTADFGWFGAVLGGLMFGFGMTLAGGCGNKTLVRIGAGNLKSVYVFLVLGIAAYATLRGLTGVARIELETLTNVDLASMGYASQGIDEFLAAALGLPAQMLRWVLTALLAGGLAAWCFTNGAFRSSPRDVVAGLSIGALIPIGWAITGIAGADDFDPQPLASFTFVAPIGESIQYLMTFTGSTIGFGIAAVGGVIFGSLLTAVATRSFHIEGFGDKSDMVRHTVGAGLMGIGGVLALGCTVGQGLSGISTLALGSLIATFSIVAGGILGMKYLEEGSLGGALKAVAGRA